MIYAIGMGEGMPIKFGKAKNPRKRLNALQGATPYYLSLLASCDLPDECEVLVHIYLRDSYIRGEWFEPTRQALDLVDLMRAGDVDGVLNKIGRKSYQPRFNKAAYQRPSLAVAGRIGAWRGVD